MNPPLFAKIVGGALLSVTTLALFVIGLEGYLDRVNKERKKKKPPKKDGR
jgi:hypothetical protein